MIQRLKEWESRRKQLEAARAHEEMLLACGVSSDEMLEFSRIGSLEVHAD
jgi:hypothetical protein